MHPAVVLVRLGLALGASTCFVVGTLFMKPAAGLTRPGPTIAVFACFACGLVLDVLLVRVGGDLGGAALAILGTEAVLLIALAGWLYGEAITLRRVAALVLVMVGVLLALAGEEDVASSPSPLEPRAQLRPAGDAELGVDPLQVGVDRAA